ncbi:MAG: hypothetical protein GY947_02050 [Rhodobacteraceae bacterium]|nr:hypothetical protein [Paracoccaceae bacterium]
MNNLSPLAIYPFAYQLFRKTFGLALAVGVITVTLEAFAPFFEKRLTSKFLVIAILLHLFVTYEFNAYRAALTGQNFGVLSLFQQLNRPTQRYWLIFLGFGVLFLVPVLVVFGIVVFMPEAHLVNPNRPDWDSVWFITAVVFGGAIFVLALANFGVLFPAASQGHSLSLRSAAIMTKEQRWGILGKLLLGPVSFTVLVLGFLFLPDEIFLASSTLSEDGQFQPIGAAISLALELLSSFTTCLLVAVLAPIYTSAITASQKVP